MIWSVSMLASGRARPWRRGGGKASIRGFPPWGWAGGGAGPGRRGGGGFPSGVSGWGPGGGRGLQHRGGPAAGGVARGEALGARLAPLPALGDVEAGGGRGGGGGARLGAPPRQPA